MKALPQESSIACLKAEHRLIERVLVVLRRLVDRAKTGEGFEVEALTRCVEFFRSFADTCHHGKEEGLLFPVLESRGIDRVGGPIGVMLQEHQLAREYTAEMGHALAAVVAGDPDGEETFREAAERYLDLLHHHILKEDNVLFELGGEVLTGEDESGLCAGFGEQSCQSFGGLTRAELEQMALDLEREWASLP